MNSSKCKRTTKFYVDGRIKDQNRNMIEQFLNFMHQIYFFIRE